MSPRTLIVAPEPADWLPHLLRAHPEAEVIAPWALPALPLQVRLPAALARRWAARQAPPGARIHRLPGWLLLEALEQRWVGGQVDRRYRALFARRRALDRLLAACIAGQHLIAPTLAARHLQRRAASTTVVLDLPLLAALHADLDAAARAHPEARFLQRYRAPEAVVQRQQAELGAATRVLVRTPYAAQVLAAAGISATLLRPCPPVAPLRVRAGALDAPRLLLAGPATARNGTLTALEVLARWPAARLVVRPSEGTEPAALLTHPRVEARGTPSLEGVDAVLALGWCESLSGEVFQAISAGIPVVATAQAGVPGAAVVPRGDAAATVACLQGVLQAAGSSRCAPRSASGQSRVG